MTVAELIAHLQTFSQTATVYCLQENHAHYQTWVEWTELQIGDVDPIGEEIIRIGDK